MGRRGRQLALLLLLLLCGLQASTGHAEVASKIDIDLVPDSFDDQYQGCVEQVMRKLTQEDYFMKEIEAHKNYSISWQKAHLTWLGQARGLPKDMVTTHAIALLVYTSNHHVRSDFARAMASAARSPRQYKDSFHFKYLHYYLTSAIQLLRKEVSTGAWNDSLCYEVHHRMKEVHLQANIGATVRFGQFLSTSLLREEAQDSGNQTRFTLFTCLGAPIQNFSLKKEVLVPPYELFEVVNRSFHPKGDWWHLRSAGNWSTYNCQLLKGNLGLNWINLSQNPRQLLPYKINFPLTNHSLA
ncbi:ecto-ADP-ribosyltransferase 4 [Ctenodactylus gundi]